MRRSKMRVFESITNHEEMEVQRKLLRFVTEIVS